MELAREVLFKCRSERVRVINALWKDDPKGNCFWLLEYFLVLGGTRFEPKTFWQHVGWYSFHLLALFQYCIQVLNVITYVSNWQENTSTIWSMLSLLAMTMCCVKQLLLWMHRKSIDNCSTFINGRLYSSGDPSFDATTRRQSYRTSQRMLVAMFVTVILDDIFIGTPNPLRDRLFGIPSWLFDYGRWLGPVVQFFFCWFFGFVWVSKLFCTSAMVASMLIGLRAELHLVAHVYGRILGCLKEELAEGDEFYGHYAKSPETRDLFWKELKQRLGTNFEQHCAVLKSLQSMQVIFEQIFFIMYYQTLIVFGSVFYVVLSEPFSICGIAIGFCVTITALECYWWCYLVDSFIDINESIVEHVLRLAIDLPHSQDHHAEYAEMRSSLLIIGMNSRNSVEFNCVGVFPISTAVFADLINISYSVLTFLLNTM